MINKIVFIKGDATNPKGEGHKLIVHICNDIGKWGRGFVLALSNKWKKPEKKYKQWYKENNNFKLGVIQFVKVESNISVINMIAQRGIYPRNGRPPIRYEVLRDCLKSVYNLANTYKATIHMPRIGCGLAGGKWELVENIITEELIDKNIKVYVYDF